MQINPKKTTQKARHSVTNAGLVIFNKRAAVLLGSTESPPGSLLRHELRGSSELVSHHAQELLALLKYIQVNQRNLHQGII